MKSSASANTATKWPSTTKPYSFRQGRQAENRLLGHLTRCQISGSLNPDQKDPAWDLRFRLDGRDATIEVKFDVMALRTGNVALEYYNPRSNKVSGLLRTEADLWGLVLADDTVWLARVDQLKRAFESEPGKFIDRAGDGNASLKLLPMQSLLEKIFTRIDHLDEHQLKGALSCLLSSSP